MVVLILGVVKFVPVPRIVPPVEAAYQFIVPAEAVALRVVVPLTQIFPGVVPVIVGIAFTVAITAVLVAVVQPNSDAST